MLPTTGPSGCAGPALSSSAHGGAAGGKAPVRVAHFGGWGAAGGAAEVRGAARAIRRRARRRARGKRAARRACPGGESTATTMRAPFIPAAGALAQQLLRSRQRGSQLRRNPRELGRGGVAAPQRSGGAWVGARRRACAAAPCDSAAADARAVGGGAPPAAAAAGGNVQPRTLSDRRRAGEEGVGRGGSGHEKRFAPKLR